MIILQLLHLQAKNFCSDQFDSSNCTWGHLFVFPLLLMQWVPSKMNIFKQNLVFICNSHLHPSLPPSQHLIVINSTRTFFSCVLVVFCCCQNDFKSKGSTLTIRAKCRTLAVEGVTALLLETIPSLFSKGFCTSPRLHVTSLLNEEGKGHPGEDDSSELACILMLSGCFFFLTALIRLNFVRWCIFPKWWCNSFSWRSVASSVRYSALLYY